MHTGHIFFSIYTLFLHPCITASWAEETLAALSRAEKIGQLIIARVEMEYDLEDVVVHTQRFQLGGIIPLHPWKLEKHIELINAMRHVSLYKLKAPLLIVEDAEWGCAMRVPALPSFPRALTLGALYPNNIDLIYQIGYAIGTQCQALGIHFNCAPVVDVNSNYSNPIIGMRSFGDEPDSVGLCAVAYIKGMQDAGIIPCIKHFPGHGNTCTDSHLQLPIITSNKEYIEKYDCAPFIYCLQHTDPAVMVGHLAVPALEKTDCVLPATLSPIITQRYLQNDIGFTGLVISDALDMHALAAYGDPGNIALQALKAGIDILLCPPDIDAMITYITHALETGEYTEAQLDAHVLKVLQIKELLGLHLQQAQKPILKLYEELIQDAYDAAATACNGFSACMPYEIDNRIPITIGSPQMQQVPLYDPVQEYIKPLLIHLYPGGHRTHRLTAEQGNTLIHIAATYPGSIILLFGSPYCLMDIPDTLPTLVLYEDTAYTHRTAEKMLSCKLLPTGALPITIVKS